MKIIKFTSFGSNGKSNFNEISFGVVDIAPPWYAPWRAVTQRKVHKQGGMGSWRFSDNGQYTPEMQVETISQALDWPMPGVPAQS